MAVVAQKFMMKKDVQQRDTKTAMPRASTQHGDMFGSVLEGTTNDSIHENTQLASMNKTTSIMWDADAFRLPSILDCGRKADTSPFKGFLDISIVNQQLRKTLPDA